MKKTFIVALILFTWSSQVMAQNSMSNSENNHLPQKGICAHRGATETHPENTLAAFKEAIRLGAQMIEFDVQMTKDNQLVIMHDARVDRTTNGKGLVSELTLSDIKKLDAGKWKSRKFKRERVPTLKETLEIMPDNIWLNIHLKGDAQLGAATASTVIASGKTHQAVIAAAKEAIKGVKQLSPNLMICNIGKVNYQNRLYR